MTFDNNKLASLPMPPNNKAAVIFYDTALPGNGTPVTAQSLWH